MAITNYSELKLAVIKWSKRDDLDLLIDDFIRLAEDEMLSNSVENLKIRGQETRSTASSTVSSRYIALPDDFLSMRRLVLIDDELRTELKFRTPEQLNVTEVDGIPFHFTVTSQLEFDRPADQVYTLEMQYIAGFTGLTSTNTTNTVLTESPNIYLFGCLRQAFRYAQDEQEEARYFAMFNEAIAGSNRKFNEGRYGPRPRVIRRGTKP